MEENKEGIKEPKKEKVYLSNEEVEKEEWELISIDIKPQDKRCGIIDVRLAYKDDIRDIYTIRSSGSLHLNKVYPNFIKRQIISRIKEVIEDKVPAKKTTTTVNTINRNVTILQPIKRLKNNGENS